MSSGNIIPLPRSGNPALATRTPSSPAPWQKDEFKNLIRLRARLLLSPPESPFSTFAAEKMRPLLKTPSPAPAAVAELSKAIAAESKRRTEADAAREQTLQEVENVISAYQKQRRQEAREAWQEYLEELNQQSPVVDAFKEEIDAATARIDQLKGEESPKAAVRKVQKAPKQRAKKRKAQQPPQQAPQK